MREAITILASSDFKNDAKNSLTLSSQCVAYFKQIVTGEKTSTDYSTLDRKWTVFEWQNF